MILFRLDGNGDEDYHIFAVNLETNSERDLTPGEGFTARIIGSDRQFPNEVDASPIPLVFAPHPHGGVRLRLF